MISCLCKHYIYDNIHQMPHHISTKCRIIRCINTLRPRQDGCRFSDDILKSIVLNETVSMSIKISLKCVPKCPINNILALVQIRALRRPDDRPLSEQMLISSLMHICVTRPQWVSISKLEQKSHTFAIDIFRWFFFEEICSFFIYISWEFSAKNLNNYMPALWR